MMLVSSLIVAIGFNMFLIPHQMLSGGVSGISMILGYFTPFSQSTTYFALNLPLLILGWFLVGRKFIVMTLWSVISTTLLLMIVPVEVVATDSMLSAVFGGVFVGIGSGLAFKAGGCTGGFDVIASIISRRREFPVGTVVNALNLTVVVAIGYLSHDWNSALNSAICIFLTGKIIDSIYVANTKVTLYIVTDKSADLTKRLLNLPPRGITKIKAEGGLSGIEKDMIMTVTTRYELNEVKEIIKEVDPEAFVNISQTMEVMGQFRKLA
jgi:uncharacterized membrane-anchored protein YitT (DUF2179 family)